MTDRPDPSADPWAVDPAATQRTPVPDPVPATSPAPPRAGGSAGHAPVFAAAPPSAGAWRNARRDDGRAGSIVFGVILVAIGIWFFVEQTLGFDLPELRWDELWPLILIGIGVWVVLGARRARD